MVLALLFIIIIIIYIFWGFGSLWSQAYKLRIPNSVINLDFGFYYPLIDYLFIYLFIYLFSIYSWLKQNKICVQ